MGLQNTIQKMWVHRRRDASECEGEGDASECAGKEGRGRVKDGFTNYIISKKALDIISKAFLFSELICIDLNCRCVSFFPFRHYCASFPASAYHALWQIHLRLPFFLWWAL